METFITYLIKVNLIISLFYFFYWVFLRREKFFQLNRVFLSGSIVISLFLPVIPSGIDLHDTEWGSLPSLRVLSDHGDQPLTQTVSLAENPYPAEAGWSAPLSLPPLADTILFLYVAIASCLFLRFVSNLLRLYFFIRKTRTVAVEEGISHCEHDFQVSPFSFFSMIVINTTGYDEQELRQIRAHEKIHIRQWHTCDLLFVELAHIFLWINPLMIFVKACIKLNLEYIADQEVIDSGFNRKRYQSGLFNSYLKSRALPLTNLFSTSKLKLRIQMMNTKRSPARRVYKYSLVFPVVFSLHLLNALHGQGMKTADNGPDLGTFEGYYLLKDESKYGLRIHAADGGLILRELWTDREIPFKRISSLEFSNTEMNFSLQFKADKAGDIHEVLALGRDLWYKVNNLTPSLEQEFRLTQEELKAFEGFYQFDKNPEAYLQFSVKENGLLAKQIWDGREFFILPKAALEFYSVNERYPAKFAKDKAGHVTQVLVFNQDVWKKVAKYEPRKTVKLSPEKLVPLEGKYTFEFEPGQASYITITSRNGQLVLKEGWSGNEVMFDAINDLEFYNIPRAFPLKFIRGDGGNIVRVLAFNRDLWTRIAE